MIDTKAIRSKILDLAIRGKLTEQLPEDGTAEGLYQQIQEEKQALIKSSKIKKEKPLPEIAETEIPFEIPDNWKWVRVGTVSEIAGGTTPKSTEISSIGTIPYFKVSDMNVVGNETHMVHASNYISSGYSGKIFSVGTTIFPKNGGAALTNKRRVLVKPSAVDLNTGGCTPFMLEMKDWIRLFMDTIDFGKMDTGSNIPTVNATNLKNQLLPLPPLAEQKRIVEKIEQAFSVLDTIDELQAKYADNLTALKSKLIDLAIRGKLTEQLPEDGTAEELYQQIQEEKQALIKSGKIKKEKPLPEIAETEIPFEIPDSWKWVRLSSAFDVRDGTHDTPKYYDHGVPLVTSKNLSSGILGFEDVKLISSEDAVKINERSKVNRGDILFAMIGTIGNPVIVDTDVEFCIKNVALFKPLQGTKLNMEYLRFYLLMEQNELKRISVGGLQPFVSLKQFRNHPFPLPPLAEQKRIVDRLDKLLAVCDEMKV